jgi:hypothetical protein
MWGIDRTVDHTEENVWCMEVMLWFSICRCGVGRRDAGSGVGCSIIEMYAVLHLVPFEIVHLRSHGRQAVYRKQAEG